MGQASTRAQLEEKLNGYPESLGLLGEEEAQEQKAASEMRSRDAFRGAQSDEQTATASTLLDHICCT